MNTLFKDIPDKIILGAGTQQWDGWIPTHQHELDLKDRSSFQKYFGEVKISAFLCEHVWEHLTLSEGYKAAELCYDYLAPGGRIRVAVPDANFPDEHYQKLVQVGGPGPKDHPAVDHKIVYTFDSLKSVFEKAGFTVSLLEWWDPGGNFHYENWDIADGPIYRSVKLDARNEAFRKIGTRPVFTSLIIDAIKG